MVSEEVFNTALNAFTMNTMYMAAVGQEIGKDRALAILTKMCENIGPIQGEMLKQQHNIQGDDAKAALAMKIPFDAGMGISFEVMEESPQKVVVKVGRCPLYEACQMAGLDAEEMCRAASIPLVNGMLKTLNPALSYELQKFRSSADDYCIEAYVLR